MSGVRSTAKLNCGGEVLEILGEDRSPLGPPWFLRLIGTTLYLQGLGPCFTDWLLYWLSVDSFLLLLTS